MTILKELLSLNEMAKRSTADVFLAAAKSILGAEKLKSVKWPDIARVAKEADILIPPAVRAMKSGRGTWDLSGGSKEEPKKSDPPKKEEPKAEPKKDEPKAEKTYTQPSYAFTMYHDWPEFRSELKKQFGDVETKRVPHGPQRSGRHGVKLGIDLIVDKKTDKVLGYWETTRADMVPGRGFVSYGSGQLAKAQQDAPKKEEPKKVARSGGKATDEELKAALQDARSSFRSHQMDPIEKNGKSFMFGTRDWGRWEGDDGSGDYDHQNLTRESSKKARDILDDLEKRHKNVKLSFDTGEKNWLYVYAE